MDSNRPSSFFIKLTECNGNVVILNTNRIEHITKGSKGFDTYIKLLNNIQGKPNEPVNKENYFFVKESVENDLGSFKY